MELSIGDLSEASISQALTNNNVFSKSDVVDDSSERNDSISFGEVDDLSSPLCQPNTEGDKPSTKIHVTVHQNPDWLSDLKKNFKAEIIDVCSLKAREAVSSNELIELDKEFHAVKNEIINSLMTWLKKAYAGVGKPSNCHVLSSYLFHVIICRQKDNDAASNILKLCISQHVSRDSRGSWQKNSKH